MKITSTIVILLLFFLSISFGQTKIRTKSGSLFQKKEPKTAEPVMDETVIDYSGAAYDVPFMTAVIDFTEPSGNEMLDANEEGYLTIKILNNGKMTAKNCELQFNTDINQSHIITEFEPSIGSIDPSQEKELTIKLKADELIPTGRIS